MANIDLSDDQKNVIEKLNTWIKNPMQPYVTLGGYAGTGKTTLIAVYRNQLAEKYPDLRVAFCAFTGKAARVLDASLKNADSTHKHDSVSTIHSLIYKAVVGSDGQIAGWRKKEELECDMIVVDEASMVDMNIWTDLLSYNKPILAVGDHGQLPPVGSNFNLMQNPMFRLERIHRQVEGHPIIAVSILARQHGFIPVQKYATGVVKYDRKDPYIRDTISDFLDNYNPETLLLCGYNATRVRLNNEIRGRRDFETPEPKSGDKVICLRNNHQALLYNGLTGHISEIDKVNEKNASYYFVQIDIDDEDRVYSGYILADQFGEKETLKEVPKNPEGKRTDLFDFGYATTVHKAQGSQADKVVVFEERFSKSSEEDWRRWLYTAVTRAKNELYIIGD